MATALADLSTATARFPEIRGADRRTPDRTRLFGRCAAIAFALAQAWVYRFYSNPDGTAYRDIARAYLRGDWAHALSTYWSPFYSWILAAFFAVFGQEAARMLPLTHMVNLLGFLASLYAWELLFAEWEKWQGPPAHRGMVQIAGYGTLLWAGVHLMPVSLDTPDLFVLAVLLGLAALLVRVRRDAARRMDYPAIGVLIGIGFLTKAACLVLLPAVLIVLAAMIHSVRDRRLWIACAAACLTMAPFITAISVSRHRFVLSDTGTLNYSMLVGGYSIEGYKESVTPLPRDLPHPVTDRSSGVRVLSFENHVSGTYPFHSDPSWWLQGLPVRANRALAWWALESGALLSLWLFTGCPSLVLAILGLPAGGRGMWQACKRLWFIVIPALALLAGYVAVVVHARYIAGCLAIFGFVPIAGMWGIRLSARRQRLFKPLMIAMMFFAMWYELVSIPFFLAGQILHFSDPWKESGLSIAESMQHNGLRPGDRVGIVGSGIFASSWVELAGAQVVAIVPPKIFHEPDRITRYMKATFEQPDRFWAAGPDTQAAVLNAMRAAGARWVVADNLPKGVTPGRGWLVAGTQKPWKDTRSDVVYYRNLSKTTLSSR